MMKSPFEWLKEQSKKFSENIFLIDSDREITYAENFQRIESVMAYFKDIEPGTKIVFFGNGSVESYQLYYAVIATQGIWIPVSYQEDYYEALNPLLEKIKPNVIIYENSLRYIIDKLNIAYRILALDDIFDSLDNEEVIDNDIYNHTDDRVISYYLTSGSTNLPKIVQHGWYATIQHAMATTARYPFTPGSRLFNPRHIFHVTGAFPLTTIMHSGGSIIIPDADSYKKNEEKCMFDWAEIIQKKKVTHISFFPGEMRQYAQLIDEHPEMRAPTLQRITTGGEALELSDLIKIARALTIYKRTYDYLWQTYPYLNSVGFYLLKKLYEQFNGALVQIAQTYGATELTCNAVANDFETGPDPRGIGSALQSLHAQITDEEGHILPKDGRHIGRLEFFGNSIAHGYLAIEESDLSRYRYQDLSLYHYKTSDLASIYPNGNVTLFGRVENLIKLGGDNVNPVLFERSIKNLCKVDAAIIFEHQSKLHVAVKLELTRERSKIILALKRNPAFSMITTISFWNDFPRTLGGKTDKNGLIQQIKTGQYESVDINLVPIPRQNSYCSIC
ncbi:MAG: acyl--CoA ligase [Legionellales bacterium]|nr:acyl--CoA ligase [Legionellales bacterium]